MDGAALAGLFELFADRIECVVLNACYSEVQAKAIARHIPYVVGMNKAIGDRAAIEFAVGFYDGLGAGRSVEFAYKLGRNSIELAGIAEHLTPQLLPKINVLDLSGSSPARVERETEQPMEYNLNSPTGKKSQIQIFIAHANEDKPQVRELYTKLKQAGYKPWLDEEDLIPGLNWREEIPKALKSSDLFLACLSSTSIKKRGYIQKEFKMAMEMLAEMPSGTIYLIPLKLDDCEIPELRQSEYGLNLRDLQWLDYWKSNGFEKLIKAIEYQFGSKVTQKTESPLPSTVSNGNLTNNSNDSRRQSLQRQKEQIESQIVELEKLSNKCTQDIKAESNAARRSQLNTQIDNYSTEIDELYDHLDKIKEKIYKSCDKSWALLNQGMNLCYVHAEMDEQVVINRVTTVEVTLSRELLKPTESHTSQTNTAEIDYNKLLLLQAIPKTNFTVVGEDCLEIDPPTVGNPRLHYFDLRATHIGKGEVWIVVRQGQVPLSTIKLKPEIIHSRAEILGVQKTNINSYLNLNSNLNEPPNQLTIIERRKGQEIRYDYEFRSISLKILNRYESKPITSERYEYVEKLYKEIETRWLSTQDDVDLFADELRAFGGQLFDQLFPEELQKILWEHHSNINSIMVISTEPFIPWELVHLKPPGQKNLPDETKFFGQMGLVRWLYDAGWPPESIQIRNQRVYCIIPQYPIAKYQLPQAQQECKLLVENFQVVLVEAQQKPVLELIKAGQFDLLHFAGHGIVDPKNMTSSKLMLEGRLESNKYIKNYLNSTIVEQFFHMEQDENRPMVVLNACQVGQSGYALTGMSGFAQAFLKGGAGAFVGPLWSVGDRPARIFIESLYRELLNGLNLSEATRLSRNTAKKTGDATWLSYSVYGHPHLRFIPQFSNAKSLIS